MSIREYRKDHLKEFAGVELATQKAIVPPESLNPLIFWTGHKTENYKVNLIGFSDGVFERPPGARKIWLAYSGRPGLIRQLLPAIQNSLLGAARRTVQTMLDALRRWWRVLDDVEIDAKNHQQRMTKVDDVRQLTIVHSNIAHRKGIRKSEFSTFRLLVNATLQGLGETPLYWQSPKDPIPQRHILPENHAKVLRIALKQAWEEVLKKWALLDSFRTLDTEPDNPQDADLFRHARHFLRIQEKFGKELPSAIELREGADGDNFTAVSNLRMTTLRESRFPTRWDVDAAFHLCLASTGWNSSTLFHLDVSGNILRSHPKDSTRFILADESYELVGRKARAGGKEHFIFGHWKTKFGPGFIIRTWMERVKPLRKLLKERLEAEQKLYAVMTSENSSEDERVKKFQLLQRLDGGSRNVWLYVDRGGEVQWLEERNPYGHMLDLERVSFLKVITSKLNAQREIRDESRIACTTPRDFRRIFAMYVWRQSGGNILAVQRALRHSQVNTTLRYLDNNILNAERDQASRNFMNHLFNELGEGRLDLTILAHLNKYGVVPLEMQDRLAQYRKLSRSRISIACKDPKKPPDFMRSSLDGNSLCITQRCLLCKTHAVILPESMPGIAQRVEELLMIMQTLAIEAWCKANFGEELNNGFLALNLFSPDLVMQERSKWREKILTGLHPIPGFSISDFIEGGR